jgi:hypothetical protein
LACRCGRRVWGLPLNHPSSRNATQEPSGVARTCRRVVPFCMRAAVRPIWLSFPVPPGRYWSMKAKDRANIESHQVSGLRCHLQNAMSLTSVSPGCERLMDFQQIQGGQQMGLLDLHTFGKRNSWLTGLVAGLSRRLELRFHSQRVQSVGLLESAGEKTDDRPSRANAEVCFHRDLASMAIAEQRSAGPKDGGNRGACPIAPLTFQFSGTDW